MGAYLFKNGGYLCVFGTSVIFHLTAVLYTAFVLPEVPQPKPVQFTVGKHGWYGTWNNTFESGLKSKRIRYYSEREHDTAIGIGSGASTSTEDSELNNNPNSENNSLLPPLEYHGKSQYRTYTDHDHDIEEEETDISVKDFVVGSMKSIVKKRPGHTRKCLLSLGFIMLFYVTTYNGNENDMF